MAAQIPLHPPVDVTLTQLASSADSTIAESTVYTGAHKPLPHHEKNLAQGHPFDRLLQAGLAKLTFGVSPISLSLAVFDWVAHVSMSPGKRSELLGDAYRDLVCEYIYLCDVYLRDLGQRNNDGLASPVSARPQDHRFDDEGWGQWPYNFYRKNFLLGEKWWDKATRDIRGVSRHHLDIVNFVTRQALDALSPSNVPWMNPTVIDKTLAERGENLLRGYENGLRDCLRFAAADKAQQSEHFKPGKDVATTPGKVMYRNRLIELIQYTPTTTQVNAEPLLIVPAWIMKYYILDLSPQNSMVKYLLDKGHTVFMISWKNPDIDDRDLGLEDYLHLGVMAALETVRKIVPEVKVHTVGYCLGGTLLMMAAAWMARKKMDYLASVTLFAAQTDFEEAGELMLFVDESQLAFVEDIMWEQGYLEGGQMLSAFSMLRTNDLIWSRLVRDYLMGEPHPGNDLMAWNADVTRMPSRMHSEYLRSLYLNNELSEGHCRIGGDTVTLSDIRAPIFAVGTVKDHVAPWQSVYKLHLYTDTEMTFVLTTGGHNAGIVSEPGHLHRSYQIATQKVDGSYLAPDKWVEAQEHHEGSWWPAWESWLVQRSGNALVAPPAMGSKQHGLHAVGDAPGTYVLQR